MSTDTPTATDAEAAAANAAGDRPESSRSPPFSCGLCDAAVGDDGRYLACYPTAEAASVERADRDGLLALCGPCGAAVAELTDAWDERGPPELGETPTIAAGYRERASDCSFCEDAIGEGPVVGIDAWPAGGATRADDARPSGGADRTDDAAVHYALCGSCVAVFAEFLTGVTPE